MRMIRWLLCVVVLTTGALGQNQSFAAKPEAPPNPQPSKPNAGLPGASVPAYPNMILITMDTTRADRMGFLGSKRGLTPNLDVLARRSVVFTRAYSQAPLTPASHATIFTGTYPQYHQVLTFPIPLATSLPYLPDILKARGYHTAAFVGSLALDATWGAPGFQRGYDTYDAGFSWADYHPGNRYQTIERRADDVVKHALAWLNKRPQGPFFLWIHVFDPHDPYDPPEPYKTRYAKSLYDGEVAYMDSALGRLFAQLKARGLYDGTLITITADHGESLGAHGENEHGVFLYDETIHVPLLIKLPHSQAAGRRVENPVELADILPTLLETLGMEIPKEVQGVSMVKLMNPGPEGEAAEAAWRDRAAYSQSDYEHLAFAWSALQSWRTGKYLYIQAPRRELYDYGADANALHNLASESPAVADTFAAKLKDFQQKTTNAAEMPRAAMDEANARKLRALGYMGGINQEALQASLERGADPKDKIEVVNDILRINDLLENYDCPKAIPELKKAIAGDPNISILHFYLGGCYLEAKDNQKALPELREAVRLDPGFTHAEMNLGRTLMELGKYEEAATAFEHVTKTEPHLMDAHVFLVVAYAKLNRVPEEISECRRVLQSNPDHFGSNFNLGRFLAQSGDLEGAVPPLEKAAQLRPDNPGPHMFLADVYERLGRKEDAKREREEIERLGVTPLSRMRPEPNEVPQSPEQK